MTEHATTPRVTQPRGFDDLIAANKRYSISFPHGFDGIAHQASFQPPAGEWAVVRLPLEGFVATWRGRPASAEPPTAVQIKQIGLLIADRQAGPFRLDVREIALGD